MSAADVTQTDIVQITENEKYFTFNGKKADEILPDIESCDSSDHRRKSQLPNILPNIIFDLK